LGSEQYVEEAQLQVESPLLGLLDRMRVEVEGDTQEKQGKRESWLFVVQRN